MTSVEEYRLLGFADADREAAEAFTPDQTAVKELADQIRGAIGKLGSEPEFKMPEDPRNSVQAFLDTVPDIRRFHTERGIPDDISWASLADLGQQLKVSRRTHGEYSLETHWWLTNFWVGNLYWLGRLQYMLFQVTEDKPVPGTEPGEWIIGVHIPETGPLTPELVDDSIQQAREFFPRHFPEYPVRTANLWSWLLDPYLLDNLPQDSNMVKFGRRFTPYGTPNDSQDSAIFFTFRTHGLDHLDELPQDTRLQRLVVGRIKDGGTWQSAYGYTRL